MPYFKPRKSTQVQALGADRASALLGLAVAKYPTHDAEVGELVQLAHAASDFPPEPATVALLDLLSSHFYAFLVDGGALYAAPVGEGGRDYTRHGELVAAADPSLRARLCGVPLATDRIVRILSDQNFVSDSVFSRILFEFCQNSFPRRSVFCVGAFRLTFHGQAFDDAWSFRNCSFKASRRKKEEKEKGKKENHGKSPTFVTNIC